MEISDTKVYHIYIKIKQAIETGKIMPGDRLVIRKIAKEYSVSEIPVREALIQLSKEGLLHNVPHSGMRVASISYKRLDDVLALRETLEPFAAKLAAENMDDDGLVKIKKCMSKMEQYRNKDDLSEYCEMDKEFHSLIVGYSGNEELIEFLYRLHNLQNQVMRAFSIYPYILESSNAEHRLIAECLESKDSHLAEKIMYVHKRKYCNLFRERCKQPMGRDASDKGLIRS